MQPWWINIQKGALRCWETVPKWFSVFDRFPWNLIFFIRFKREARKFKFREVVHFHWIWKKHLSQALSGSLAQCSPWKWKGTCHFRLKGWLAAKIWYFILFHGSTQFNFLPSSIFYRRGRWQGLNFKRSDKSHANKSPPALWDQWGEALHPFQLNIS